MSRRGPLPPGDPRHGSHNGYCNYLCRCDECGQAESEYQRQWRADNQDRYQRGRDRDAARFRAMVKLSKMYPQDFRALYAVELLDVEPASNDLVLVDE